MVRDIAVSQTLVSEYKRDCMNNTGNTMFDFSMMVLSSNSWTFSAPSSFILPNELKSAVHSFTIFYDHRHNGRKLTWLYQHSNGELKTFFTSQKYILQVSTYQMVVLLLFNKELIWTVKQIQDETQIQSELLLQILVGLLKRKLLVCDEVNIDDQEVNLHSSHTIRLATDFNR